MAGLLPAGSIGGIQGGGSWGGGQTYEEEQARIREAFQRWKEMMGQQFGYYGQMANDAQQRIYNANQLASTGYSLGNDAQQTALSITRGETDILQQQQQQSRYMQQLADSVNRQRANQVPGLHDAYAQQYGYR